MGLCSSNAAAPDKPTSSAPHAAQSRQPGDPAAASANGVRRKSELWEQRDKEAASGDALDQNSAEACAFGGCSSSATVGSSFCDLHTQDNDQPGSDQGAASADQAGDDEDEEEMSRVDTSKKVDLKWVKKSSSGSKEKAGSSGKEKKKRGSRARSQSRPRKLKERDNSFSSVTSTNSKSGKRKSQQSVFDRLTDQSSFTGIHKVIHTNKPPLVAPSITAAQRSRQSSVASSVASTEVTGPNARWNSNTRVTEDVLARALPKPASSSVDTPSKRNSGPSASGKRYDTSKNVFQRLTDTHQFTGMYRARFEDEKNDEPDISLSAQIQLRQFATSLRSPTRQIKKSASASRRQREPATPAADDSKDSALTPRRRKKNKSAKRRQFDLYQCLAYVYSLLPPTFEHQGMDKNGFIQWLKEEWQMLDPQGVGKMHVPGASGQANDPDTVTFWDHVNYLISQITVEADAVDPGAGAAVEDSVLEAAQQAAADRQLSQLAPPSADALWAVKITSEFRDGVDGNFDLDEALADLVPTLPSMIDREAFTERLSRQWQVLDKENFGCVTRARLERFVWVSYGYGSNDDPLPCTRDLPDDVRVGVDAIAKQGGGQYVFHVHDIAMVTLRDSVQEEKRKLGASRPSTVLEALDWQASPLDSEDDADDDQLTEEEEDEKEEAAGGDQVSAMHSQGLRGAAPNGQEPSMSTRRPSTLSAISEESERTVNPGSLPNAMSQSHSDYEFLEQLPQSPKAADSKDPTGAPGTPPPTASAAPEEVKLSVVVIPPPDEHRTSGSATPLGDDDASPSSQSPSASDRQLANRKQNKKKSSSSRKKQRHRSARRRDRKVAQGNGKRRRAQRMRTPSGTESLVKWSDEQQDESSEDELDFELDGALRYVAQQLYGYKEQVKASSPKSSGSIDTLDVDAFVSKMRVQWDTLDSENTGSVDRSQLERFVWLSGVAADHDKPESVPPMPDKLPQEMQDYVDALMLHTGDKGFFTFWDYINMMLTDYAVQLWPPSADDQVEMDSKADDGDNSLFDLNACLLWIGEHLPAHLADVRQELLDRIEAQWVAIDTRQQGQLTEDEVAQFIWTAHGQPGRAPPCSEFVEDMQDAFHSLMTAASPTTPHLLTFWDFSNLVLSAVGVDIRAIHNSQEVSSDQP